MRSTRIIAAAVAIISTLAIAVGGIAAAFHHHLVPTTVLWIGSSLAIGLTVIAVNRDERAEMFERLEEVIATIERQDGTIQGMREDLRKALSQTYNEGYDHGQAANGKGAKVTPIAPRPSS